MGAVRGFFLGALKIAVVIVLAVVLLVALGWGGYSLYEGWDAAKNAPLGKTRTWPELVIHPLGNAKFKLSTAWRDGGLHYQFTVDSYPPAVDAAWRGAGSDVLGGGPKFTLTFLDQQGFKLFEHEVPLNRLTHAVDQSGKAVGMSAKDQTYVTADTYRRAASWEVTWNFRSSDP